MEFTPALFGAVDDDDTTYITRFYASSTTTFCVSPPLPRLDLSFSTTTLNRFVPPYILLTLNPSAHSSFLGDEQRTVYVWSLLLRSIARNVWSLLLRYSVL